MKLDPEEDDTIQYTADPDYHRTITQSLGFINASSTFASLSFAVGDGIFTGRVKVEANFQVITKDRHGNRSEGGDKLNVVIRQSDGAFLKCKIVDQGMNEIYNIILINNIHSHYSFSEACCCAPKSTNVV